ncbi:cyclase family protein [Geobacter pickeringii]|uniref:Kynurenine formamidase n=1 Tax=Geobacter pickeringii TaxID=345632 RepID=A0A0B5BBR4_9BACT|nr:cyclase family protein [Geobacter pickeringii]AJE02000.1 cyclase [Geobacter pickeringii]
MKIYDITVPLSPHLPVYPGDPPVGVEAVTRISRGDPANVSLLTLSTHSGTHLDVPRHCRDGGATVDHVPPSLLVGGARVVEVREARAIGARELARLPVRGAERLLLRTGNSLLWDRPGFQDDFAALTEEGARYLVEAGVRLVGIDYLSIERFGGDGTVHRILLDAGVVILEGLNLEGVPPGSYELICLPLKVAGGDGAPARAILRSGEPAEERPAPDLHTTRWPLS